MTQQRKVKPTPKQQIAVDNIVSGKFKSVKGAMVDAGYSEESAKNPGVKLLHSRGVEEYLKSLSIKCRQRFKMGLRDKVMEVYLDGLEATKLYGKDALERPDHLARKAFADKFAEFFGWSRASTLPQGNFNQFNYFSVDEKKRDEFNSNFRDFIKSFYKR